MASTNRSLSFGGKREMTMAQFRIWVKTLDADKDGKISKDELSDAVRGNGGWFAGWKGKRGVKAADANGNGVIDDSEIDMLAAFAQKHLGWLRLGAFSSRYRAARGLSHGDADKDGQIDMVELDDLVNYAYKLGYTVHHWNLKIQST